MAISASIIVPTHNRHAAAAITVKHLLDSATRAQGEVLVVDDGSTPPISLPAHDRLRLMRTTGVERSRARNQGACSARSELLIFVDDDITVAAPFVEQHVRAARDFDGALCVGRVSLPSEWSNSSFGRFRRSIEEPSQVRPRGLVAERNFCTAQNMSIRRDAFFSLGGFDPEISSSEDQDLALRFCDQGGRIAFLPEADVLHRDANMHIGSYCRRHEWGAMAMAPFLRRYPDRPENVVRARVAVPLRAARFPDETIRLLTRLILANAPTLDLIRKVTAVVERTGAGDTLLFPFYRVLLGLHLFRGFRSGLAQYPTAPIAPGPLRADSSQPA